MKIISVLICLFVVFFSIQSLSINRQHGSESYTHQWDNLVGKTGDQAKKIILTEDSSLNVIILAESTPVTRDYRIERVRVFVDSNGKVVSQPRIG